jgi:crossover junction endodeoxyribonuclease RuvC
MIIIAFDPSLRSTGYAVTDASSPSRLIALDYGAIHNSPSLRPAQCLQKIYEFTHRLIKQYHPTHAALEAVIYLQNVAIAITLGAARGVILLALESQGIPAYEYAPRRVKQAATGRGAAGKNQVAFMMRSTYSLEETPSHDAADALAIAWTHHQATLHPKPNLTPL